MLGTRGGYAPSRRHRSQSGASSVETEKKESEEKAVLTP